MPNYNYECRDCNNVFEVTASIKEMENGEFPCQKCGSKNTKRLFDGFGFCNKTGSSNVTKNYFSAPT